MTLSVSDLSLSIMGTAIVRGAGFTVPSGTFTAILGPNGAGKSTLLRMLTGSQRPDSGRVTFEGTDLLLLPRKKRAQLVAFAEQDTQTQFSMSVRNAVSLGRIPYKQLWDPDTEEDNEIVLQSLEFAGATEFIDRDLQTLSGGEQQRVHLARALAQTPQLLVLDEPTNHLDIHAQLRTLRLMRSFTREGVTAVAALHDLNLAASFCDYAVVMHEGRVKAVGPVAEVLTAALIRNVYHVEADILTHPRTGRPLIAMSESP